MQLACFFEIGMVFISALAIVRNALIFALSLTSPSIPIMSRTLKHEIAVLDPETGEVVTKNANFIQFYKDNLELLDQIAAERPAALRILFWITKLMDEKNALATSQSAICEALSMHRNTVTQAVNYLKENRVLAVLKMGTAYVYAVNNEIVWQDVAGTKSFALFSAKIYLSKSEQTIDYESIKLRQTIKAKKDRTSTKIMRTSQTPSTN